MARNVPLPSLLTVFTPGDDMTWPEQFEWLRVHHSTRLRMLAKEIKAEGIREPILLGSDGRVWDGHHRLAVAMRLDIKQVPVVFSGEEP